MAQGSLRFGVDLGGTKTEIVALDTSGRELMRQRVATPKGDYAAIVATIAGLVRSAEVRLNASGTVGVGIPGAISPRTGLVKNANTTSLIGHAFDKDLSAALEREVRLDNDANCFALSEAVDGAGQGARVVFGAIVGTGVGAGLTVDQRLVAGRHLIAGEWGHNPLPWPSVEEVNAAPRCYCGKHGCIETWVSGPAFAADHRRVTGEALAAKDIMAAAAAGDAGAEASYQRLAGRMARALAHVINLIDPDAIVIGGGMGQIARLYDDLPRLLPSFVFSDECTTPLRHPKHGDSSGVRGAAWLWPPAG